VNILLPSAQRALGFADTDRQWVVTAYALAFGSLLLLGGKLGDHHSNDNSHRSVGDICGAYLYLGFIAGRLAGYRPAAQRGPTFPSCGKLPCTARGQRRLTGPRLHTGGR
jgi:MFS family permease